MSTVEPLTKQEREQLCRAARADTVAWRMSHRATVFRFEATVRALEVERDNTRRERNRLRGLARRMRTLESIIGVHIHEALYDQSGEADVLLRACKKCGLDLQDDLHARTFYDLDGEGK